MTSPINNNSASVKTVLRPPKNCMYLVEKKEGFSRLHYKIKLPFLIILFYGVKIRLAMEINHYFPKNSCNSCFIFFRINFND